MLLPMGLSGPRRLKIFAVSIGIDVRFKKKIAEIQLSRRPKAQKRKKKKRKKKRKKKKKQKRNKRRRATREEKSDEEKLLCQVGREQVVCVFE